MKTLSNMTEAELRSLLYSHQADYDEFMEAGDHRLAELAAVEAQLVDEELDRRLPVLMRRN